MLTLADTRAIFQEVRAGWLGIDLGTSHAYAAQVTRDDGGFAVVSCDRQQLPAPDSRSELPSLPRFAIDAGPCAVRLPGRFLEREVIDLPAAPPREQQTLAHERFLKTRSAGEDWEAGLFPIATGTHDDTVRKHLVYGVPTRTALHVAGGLQAQRLQSQAFPIPPLIAARAAELVVGDEPTAVVEFGWERVSVTAVDSGTPLYERELNCPNATDWMQKIGSIFRTPPESAHDLFAFLSGRPTEGFHTDPPRWVSRLLKSIAPGVYSAAFATRETLDYVRGRLRGWTPSRVLLCGVGSMLPDLVGLFEGELNTPTLRWSLPFRGAAACVACGPEFASAAALSSWAWLPS